MERQAGFLAVAAAVLAAGCTEMRGDGQFAEELAAVRAGEIRFAERADDPYGVPRPARNTEDVPIGTSLFFKLAMHEAEGDTIAADSLRVWLEAEGHEPRTLVGEGGALAAGVSGWIREGAVGSGRGMLVYLDPADPLEPGTQYTVRIAARSNEGVAFAEGDPLYLPAPLLFRVLAGAERVQPAGPRRWTFTTADGPARRAVDFVLNLAEKPIRWQGAFFSGFCNVQFCTQEEIYGPTYALTDQARQRHPHAWSLQRDFWMTGTEHRPAQIFASTLPNAVRERETRRITAIEAQDDGTLLHLEDFFGHEQYGVAAGRPLSEDYRPGYTVLVANGVHDARAEVLAVDDAAGTVRTTELATPEGGWQLEYTAPPPTEENPDMPGLFPAGGCYLRRFDPHGTAVYYWGRLDKEWDMVHRHYGRRLMPNFVDAPGCLSITGRAGYTVKDYAQWHEVVRTMTGRLIDRYGDAALDFVWSVFNEPDLNRFWRENPDELLRYYDYTVDGILRAFEDRGYDSQEVFVGGLELGAIFGTNLQLREFLLHCSPNARDPQRDTRNAAYADARLEGRRSRRVEALCEASGGRGSPLDFVSIHIYNRSELAAAKLARAKEMALKVDEAYYGDLWINSHEACPGWSPLPDPAFAESYLGNGYFKSWSADLVARQLRRAADDPRYAFGETIMTVWPPLDNLQGLNAFTRRLSIDGSGDGRADRTATIPVPAFHAITLLSDMRDDFRVLPERRIAGHTVSGFASADDGGTLHVVVYAHHPGDTQSRAAASFDVEIDVRGLAAEGGLRVTEYRFDRRHNSYFERADALRRTSRERPHLDRLAAVLQELVDRGAEARDAAVEALEAIAAETGEASYGMVADHARTAGDEALRRDAGAFLEAILRGDGHFGPLSAKEAARLEREALPRPTATEIPPRSHAAPLRLSVPVGSNGVSFLAIEPAPRP